jgi:hypothetical protein
MSRAAWIRRAMAAAAVVVLAGCANKAAPPLYMWETFPRQQYDVLLREGVSADDQIRALEAHAEKARGANAALPPGFRAHLGMLYLNSGNADRARELWLAERSAFPESAPYIDRLLKRLAAPAKTAKNENPA